MDLGVQVPESLLSMIQCPDLEVVPRRGFLDHKVIMFTFTFLRTTELLSLAAAPLCMPSSNAQIPVSPRPCQHLLFSTKKINKSHPNGVK